MNLSIILPTYNESAWLPDTVKQLDAAIKTAGITKAELIIVDDGSTDDTETVVRAAEASFPVVYVKQKNSGRFVARKRGVSKAQYEYVLLIDSRVHIHEKALQFAAKRILDHPDEIVWNAHVVVEKTHNVFARFWDVITNIAWKRYFANPRHISYGVDDFDYYPKGTTCFLIQKQALTTAIASFKSDSKDLKRANDDTVLIKDIARKNSIHIAPEFSCTYHARGTLKKFLSHAFHRGQVFVDGFLKPGNRYYYPLLIFLMLCVAFIVLCSIFPTILLLVPAGIVTLVAGLFITTQALRIPAITLQDSWWFSVLAIPFGLYYGAGIWIATLRKIFKTNNTKS